MNKRLLFSLITVLFAIPLLAFAGTLTMTTYYPAPTGNYDQLNANNVGIGTVNVLQRLIVTGEGTGSVYVGASSCGGNTAGIRLHGTPMTNCNNYNLLGSRDNADLTINRPAGGDLYISENSTTQLYLQGNNGGANGTGNVGIHNSQPLAYLDIGDSQSCCASQNGLQYPTLGLSEATLNADSTPNTNRIPWLQFHASNSAEAFIRLPTGQRRLEIGDTWGVGTALSILNPARTQSNIYFNPIGSSYFRSGNLGIGVTAPAERLDVSGNVKTTGSIQWNNAGGILSTDQNASIELGLTAVANQTPYLDFHFGTGALQDYNARIINSANNRLDIRTASNGDVLSVVGGNVGINNNNPQQRLEVGGNIRIPTFDLHSDNGRSTDRPYFRGKEDFLVIAPRTTGINNAIYYSFPGDLEPGADVRTEIQNTLFISATGSAGNGFVSIGAAPNGAYKLYVNGDIGVSGNIYQTNGGAYHYDPSDSRLKENIKTIKDPLDKILKLNGVTFDWKKNKKHSIGLIAQNVEKVFPELVATNPEGFKTVSYKNLVAVLIESTKEQQRQIDALKKEIADLRKRIK